MTKKGNECLKEYSTHVSYTYYHEYKFQIFTCIQIQVSNS